MKRKLFRRMEASDWENVAEIYRQGIETGDATFQKDIPGWEEWDHGHLKACRIVVTIDGELAGWAALTPVSGRCVYAGVAEVSIYVGDKFRGQHTGIELLRHLISESEQEGIWTLQAGIFKENIPSLTIHEKTGFRTVGYRERIGKMNDRWRDTILLERRSEKTGND